MHRRLSVGTWQSEYGRALTIAFEMNRLLRREKQQGIEPHHVPRRYRKFDLRDEVCGEAVLQQARQPI
jgi:hypothetical protein